jgi:DNA-binding response OmpR family regulator
LIVLTEMDDMLGKASRNRPRALVIDGKPEEIHALTNLIQRNQWQPTLAISGKRGIQLATASAFDIILLEARLPDMDGFAVCRLLKESTATSGVPIIFLTRASSIQDRLEGLTCGGVDYLVKPCAPEEVLARMRIHRNLAHQQSSAEVAAPVPLPYEQVVLQAAVHHIRANLALPASLASIAQRVGVYEKKLSAIFRRQLGVTVFTWIREERLRKSMELLVGTPMAIQDIAEEVGFSSACNFTTAFRARTGRTPNQFRKDATGDRYLSLHHG